MRYKSIFGSGRIRLTLLSMVLMFWAANAWAADGFEFTRETYDLLMRWVNFIILAAVIIKFATRPIANFLKEKKDEVAIAIERLESQKQAAKLKLSECREQLTASDERLAQVKNKIIAEGESRKAQIIADAQNDSRIMLETARLRIAHQIREAHEQIKSELIDTAAEIALGRLPALLTVEDQNRLVDKWMQAIKV